MSQTHDGDSDQVGGGVDLTPEQRHRVLQSGRRRIALGVIADRTGPLDLEVLAAEVAAAENAGGTDRVALSLHHDHLPRLAAHGVLSYDAAARRITATDVPEDALLG